MFVGRVIGVDTLGLDGAALIEKVHQVHRISHCKAGGQPFGRVRDLAGDCAGQHGIQWRGGFGSADRQLLFRRWVTLAGGRALLRGVDGPVIVVTQPCQLA